MGYEGAQNRKEDIATQQRWRDEDKAERQRDKDELEAEKKENELIYLGECRSWMNTTIIQYIENCNKDKEFVEKIVQECATKVKMGFLVIDDNENRWIMTHRKMAMECQGNNSNGSNQMNIQPQQEEQQQQQPQQNASQTDYSDYNSDYNSNSNSNYNSDYNSDYNPNYNSNNYNYNSNN